MKIENINTGFCYHRKQPFVNWIQDEKQQYFFSPIIKVNQSIGESEKKEETTYE